MDVTTLLALAYGTVPVRIIKKLYQLPELPSLNDAAAWRQLPLDFDAISPLFDDAAKRALDAALQWAEAPDQHLIHWGHPDYPPLLMEISNPPPMLMVKGNVTLLREAQLSIVGSRHPTPSALEHTRLFARALSDAGLCITSGLAQGIDAAAHEGALAGNSKTVAVLGCGADVIYPKRNARLFAQVAEQGALVSEFPLGTQPLAEFFPRRNRIVSGLALGTLVVEAALKSGSLITARLALEQNREVFAIPGPIDQMQKEGCHYLIRQGATLIENPAQILEHFNMHHGLLQTVMTQDGKKSGHPLLKHLDQQPVSVDALAQRSGMAAPELLSSLMELELEGQVVQYQGEYRLA